MTKTEKLTRELIALPSVNPTYLPKGDPHGGEQRVAEYVASLTGKAGLETELRPVYPGRPNVLAKLTPTGKSRQRIVLAPHLDTVGGHLPGKLFTPTAKGDRLYGRGACDTKGSMAVMLTALFELARAGRRPNETEIVFVGLIDEECGQGGSRALMEEKFQADFAVIGEPTRLQVVTAHKGVAWLKITAQGQAAHGAHPELGLNAVHLMARIVDGLETEYAAALRNKTHPLLGRATVNVGAMHGGTQPNIVPAECYILLDRRILPGESEEQVLEEIRNFIDHQVAAPPSVDGPKMKAPATRVTMKSLQKGPCLALETNPKLPLVQSFYKCARQTAPAGVDFFSDAGVFSNGGIPSVLFGPGDIAHAHTPEEFVSRKQLEQAKNILLEFLRSLP